MWKWTFNFKFLARIPFDFRHTSKYVLLYRLKTIREVLKLDWTNDRVDVEKTWAKYKHKITMFFLQKHTREEVNLISVFYVLLNNTIFIINLGIEQDYSTLLDVHIPLLKLLTLTVGLNRVWHKESVLHLMRKKVLQNDFSNFPLQVLCARL